MAYVYFVEKDYGFDLRLCQASDTRAHVVGLPGFEPGSREPEELRESTLDDFKDFCMIDLGLAEITSRRHTQRIHTFLTTVQKNPHHITRKDLRNYLKTMKERSQSSNYKNILASLKRFFRDYHGHPDLVESFKFPPRTYKPIIVPRKHELQHFYQALKSARDRALFLLYATSGLRNSEVINLTVHDVDFTQRMVMPQKQENRSKHVWMSFYNHEAEYELHQYFEVKSRSSSKLFPITRERATRIFKEASATSGVKITPQLLREWFCCEMGRLKVPDRYIDAFCGRVPRSILAQHYTDYRPENLKEIYDNAQLRVLS